MFPALLALALTVAGCASAASQPPAPRAAAAAGTTAPTRGKPASGALVPITFTFDFIPNGSHAPFYAAAARGYYRAQGLDVTIREGISATDTTNWIVTGRAQFGWDPAGTVALANAKGAGLMTVAGIYATNTLGLVYRASRPLTKPSDVYGKTVGVPAGTNAAVNWREFVAVNHLDASRVKVLNIRPTAEAGLIGRGKLDAFSGGAYTFLPLAKQLGLHVGYLPYADAGVGGLAEGLTTTAAFVKAHPDWVRKFVYATAQGYAFAAAHPRQAVAYMIQRVPQLKAPLAVGQLEQAFPLMRSPQTLGKPWGWESAASWRAELTLLHDYQGLAHPLAPDSYFTNAYLPASAVSAP